MSDYRKHLYDPNSIEAKVSFGVISFVGIVAILGTLVCFDSDGPLDPTRDAKAHWRLPGVPEELSRVRTSAPASAGLFDGA